MKYVMYTLEEVKDKINAGETLLLAGDGNLLSQLPNGNWIGGTIPYFMGEDGGIITKDKLLVDTISKDFDTKISVYDNDNIHNVYSDAYDNGYSIIILPASSDVHLKFALKAPSFDNFAMQPLIGWISGVHLDDLATEKARVFDGNSNYENRAVVMHVKLEEHQYAEIEIVNIFSQGDGDTIEFLEDSFSADKALINGIEKDFYEYVKEKNLDMKFPLVADYYGTMVNISFQNVDDDNKKVYFYAPVFKGVPYKQANKVDNYIETFNSKLPVEIKDKIAFSCNCILNFLYSDLEGKKTGNITGAMTFGEIAYQLLNQTMVYLSVDELED